MRNFIKFNGFVIAGLGLIVLFAGLLRFAGYAMDFFKLHEIIDLKNYVTNTKSLLINIFLLLLFGIYHFALGASFIKLNHFAYKLALVMPLIFFLFFTASHFIFTKTILVLFSYIWVVTFFSALQLNRRLSRSPDV